MNGRQKLLYTIAICLTTAYLATVNSSHGVLLSSMIGHYGLTDAQQGLPNAMQNVGNLLALISSLWAIGRARKRTLLMGGMAVLALCMLPLGMLPAFALFAGLWLVAGVACGYVDAVGSALIADAHSGPSATRMMCMLHASNGASGILSPLALGLLVGAVSWHWAYVAVFGLGALLLCYVVPTLSGAAQSSREARRPVTAQEVKSFFRKPVLRALMGSILLHGFFLVGMVVWVSRYVEVGLSSALGPAALALLYTGITGSRLLMPFLRISPMGYVRWSNLLAGGTLAAGILSGNAWVMCGAVLVAFLLCGSMIPITLSVACAEFSSNTLLASTITNLMMLVGNCIASPLIGKVASGAGIGMGVMLCACACALSGLTACFVRLNKKG